MSTATARAIRVEQTGGPEVLEPADVPLPEPGASEVRVRNHAAGVNFLDVYHRSGQYPMETPFVPGVEGAGVVDAVGGEVEGLEVGDHVAYVMVPGGYAEYVLVPPHRIVPVPDALSTTDVASVLLQGVTAQYLTHSSPRVQEGQTVLVHAAAGGVGRLLVQFAKHLGARVLGTTSTREKAEIARGAGADEVIRYTEVDFVEEVDDLTDGRGVDVIYDAVGKETFRRGLDALTVRGTIVLFGEASGPVEPLDPGELAKKSLRLVRTGLPHYVRTNDELRERAGKLFDLIAEGAVAPRIDRTFELDKATEAHRYIEGRNTKGKVLLVP